jgi:nucleoside-diphosphate-sugar epimerase
MKALVTGGAGFIGSHIVDRLLDNNITVTILDNFSSGKQENLDSAYMNYGNDFGLVRGDIRDYNSCLYASRDVDVIFHQAALRSVPKSLNDPHEYNNVNINGTLNILKAAVENNVRRVVFASSSSIYGDTEIFPLSEEDSPQLISPYALTKLAGEYYMRIFNANYGLETVALRYFNVFGPRQALDDEYAVVIPKFIHSIINDENPPIYGDGGQSRDFTYIDNVVDANILAATTGDIKHEVLNVANGQSHTILELVRLLNEITCKDIEPEFNPVRQGDIYKTLADIRKTQEVIGYEPRTGFRKGLESCVEWFSKEWELNNKYSCKEV